MRLLDANLVIYAAKPQYTFLRPLLLDVGSCLSIISKLEALGFRNLTADDKAYLEGVFRTAKVYPINNAIIDQARTRNRRSTNDKRT